MILELAQLLSTAHWVLADRDVEREQLLCSWRKDGHLYLPTHKNHPCAIWVRQHINNYRFTCALAKALCEEYVFRFGAAKQRRHKTESVIDFLREKEPPTLLAASSALVASALIGPAQVTEPPQAMPDECRRVTAIDAYRAYYRSPYKKQLWKWSGRSQPEWFADNGK